MQSVTAETLIKRSKQITWRQVEDETILLNLENGEYYSLNQLGSKIWKIIGTDKKVKEIAAIISKEYTVNYARVIQDTINFIKQLSKHNLLELG
jgi:hypothetical protein